MLELEGVGTWSDGASFKGSGKLVKSRSVGSCYDDGATGGRRDDWQGPGPGWLAGDHRDQAERSDFKRNAGMAWQFRTLLRTA